MPGVPGSPGLPASPWQREGTRLARGRGTHGTCPAPQPRGVSVPSASPSPAGATSPAPLTFCPFWPASPGLPWGNGGTVQARASPETGTHERGGALTSLPGGPPWPLCPGGPGTASTVAAPSRACGTRGHCPHGSPCGGDIPVGVWLQGLEHCWWRGACSPRCSPHLKAVPCNELHGSQLGRFHGRGRERGPGGSPSQGSPSLLSAPASLDHPCLPGAPAPRSHSRGETMAPSAWLLHPWAPCTHPEPPHPHCPPAPPLTGLPVGPCWPPSP